MSRYRKIVDSGSGMTWSEDLDVMCEKVISSSRVTDVTGLQVGPLLCKCFENGVALRMGPCQFPDVVGLATVPRVKP
jgi:hypothetical protein